MISMEKDRFFYRVMFAGILWKLNLTHSMKRLITRLMKAGKAKGAAVNGKMFARTALRVNY